MQAKKFRDIKIRLKFKLLEQNRMILKFIYLFFFSLSKKKLLKELVITKFNFFSFIFLKSFLNGHMKSKVRINSRCVLTNRNKSVYRTFGLSRTTQKEFVQFGVLPGLKKAIW